ncbi:MAG: type II toxin-antitoxin system VapC family toxin [Polyangia bacterium]|jgi:PIN domain nuclease of toxin-antitoxin system|nr:type II toxin-antitoxin system VapC family toxin [Polyangia bacterium]
MSRYVADTHAIFWYLSGSPKLGERARKIFAEAESGKAEIFIPTIVLAELFFLHEKLGLSASFREDFLLISGSAQFSLLPMMPEHVLGFEALKDVPEMHDRIIVEVALRLRASLITRDGLIRRSGLVETVW